LELSGPDGFSVEVVLRPNCVEKAQCDGAAEKGREAEEAALRRAARFEESGDWRFAEEAPPPALPPLERVTGWSRTGRKKGKHDPGVALFGGWRLAAMETSRRSGTSAGGS
jgi:hypothetical protein